MMSSGGIESYKEAISNLSYGQEKVTAGLAIHHWTNAH